MYGLFLRPLVTRIFARLHEGDPRLLVALAAEDIHFRFPGRSPWSADHRSKAEYALWMERFAHFRPRFAIHDAIASGPPWDIRVCIRLSDSIGGPRDGRDGFPYINQGVCYARLRWGRLVESACYVDTQAVADFFGEETAEEFFVLE